jgi:hypothetical protein
MPMDWVATPPPGAVVVPPARRFGRYAGPPSYRTPPRWGFPAMAWRWPTVVPTGTEATSVIEQLRIRGRLALAALSAVAVFSVLAAAAEIWRYVLLLRARTNALPRSAVDLSDNLVTTGSVLSLTAGVLAVFTTVWWLVPARRAAAEVAGYDSARPRLHVAIALVVPGLNLIVPGAIIAELEHAALCKPVDQRPSPSALVRWWWGAIAASGVLFAATLLWRQRDGVQAMADGVLLTAATDVMAAVVAVLTALVIVRLAALLAPIDRTTVRRMRLVSVEGAPVPPLREHRPPGSQR